MMVTFVSQCEKKSLNKTRRVLDTFANRIGSRTWQTAITYEGLQAVKKLLRKTASKNSAISCHWIRSRRRTELVWIVGNRSKFNEEGFVPVNTTEKDIINSHWENTWHYLPLIKNLVTLAALFHDWGKANEFFQTKLQKAKGVGDPVRHEWLSILFLNTFVCKKTDDEWLERLADGAIDSDCLLGQLTTRHHRKIKPLAELPDAAAIVAWLILSHHRLPVPQELDGCIGESANSFASLFKIISKQWGYENIFDQHEENLLRCFDFPKGLPCASEKWRRYAGKSAQKLLDCLGLLKQALQDGSWRVVLHHCRLSLILADHYHSSQDADKKWQDTLDLFANTDRKTGNFKQSLTEHLIGVARQARRNVHLLPAFEGKHSELDRAYDVRALRKKSPVSYLWQDKAVTRIRHWREKQGTKIDRSHFGFFAVNMASTGKGKTFANAKIMRALSVDGQSLRYILALGLRTLTLQTGDEYRERIGLGTDQLAVLIGSRAVLDLHQQRRQAEQQENGSFGGSESEEELLANELVFDSHIPDEQLATVLPDIKSRKFLYAPVLSCTIDHLMAATETKRGGRFILPALRLMSSDLVIDEIDDFDGKDLIAIGRLIHLTGMLGRKVMISSATISPDLAEGYFNAYQAGWSLFAKTRNLGQGVGCAWIDEFTSRMNTVIDSENGDGVASYARHHQEFINNRLKRLKKQIVKQKAEIWPCILSKNEDEQTVRRYFNSVILDAVQKNHLQHHNIDVVTGKQVSFGLVRVANITPCIDLTKFLLTADVADNIELRVMAYHSQQLLIMRSEQEKHLDTVLKRKNGSQPSFDQEVIRNHLDSIKAQHVIFILVATPVEEVGRDHDFDWAVVEPSSYRSFIQLSGRVLRHHDLSGDVETPNISLLQYNLKGLLQRKYAYCRPGFESEKNPLITHDLQSLLIGEPFADRLDAGPRISRKRMVNPGENLAGLEHEVIHQLLTDYQQQGPESLQGWLNGCWWLTAVPQRLVRFREGAPQLPVYLVLHDGEWRFVEKEKFGKINPIEELFGIEREEGLSPLESERLWLYRDYESLLEKLAKSSIKQAALIYGEIGLPTFGKESLELHFIYSSQLGLMAK